VQSGDGRGQCGGRLSSSDSHLWPHRVGGSDAANGHEFGVSARRCSNATRFRSSLWLLSPISQVKLRLGRCNCTQAYVRVVGIALRRFYVIFCAPWFIPELGAIQTIHFYCAQFMVSFFLIALHLVFHFSTFNHYKTVCVHSDSALFMTTSNMPFNVNFLISLGNVALTSFVPFVLVWPANI